jgi:hypothetical protein
MPFATSAAPHTAVEQPGGRSSTFHIGKKSKGHQSGLPWSRQTSQESKYSLRLCDKRGNFVHISPQPEELLSSLLDTPPLYFRTEKLEASRSNASTHTVNTPRTSGSYSLGETFESRSMAIPCAAAQSAIPNRL